MARAHAVELHRGLHDDEAARRAELHGPNELVAGARRSPWRLLLEQFTDFMILVLVGAAVLSGVLGDLVDTLAILVIVVLNGLVGFVQAWRADRALAALKRLAAAHATVLRDGKVRRVAANALVPGDVVLIEAGNQIPADLRLTEVARLLVDESALTGESVSVEKHARVLGAGAESLGDRLNMAYKGTTAAHGRGRGLVVATGMSTELGKVADLMAAGGDRATPLQLRLAAFGRRLAIAVLGICALIFAIGVLRGEPPVLMLLTAVSLAVAAIPEALPAVVTVLLALGARRMVSLNALVRRLPSVETLGSVTFICSDKTGTLTQNRMHVEEVVAAGEVWVPGQEGRPGPRHLEILRAGALCNDAASDGEGRLAGRPDRGCARAGGRRGGHRQGRARSPVPARARAAVRLGAKADDNVPPGARRPGGLHEGCPGIPGAAVHRPIGIQTAAARSMPSWPWQPPRPWRRADCACWRWRGAATSDCRVRASWNRRRSAWSCSGWSAWSIRPARRRPSPCRTASAPASPR